MSQLEFNAYKREEAEKDLSFCGFLIAECPLKPDTKKVILELKASSHEVKMITGDNQLTAAFVAQELTFGSGPSLFVTLCEMDKSLLMWNDIDDKEVTRTKSWEEVEKLASKNLLCISGEHLEKLISFSDAQKYMKYIHVFSRTSPTQKGIIVSLLNAEGHGTLMCGDGTNDVGSLKRADVGIAIVNNREPTKEEKAKRKELTSGMNPWTMMKAQNVKEEFKGKSMIEMQQMQKKKMEEF